MKTVQIATGLLLNEKGEVLFLQRSPASSHWPGEWQFPEGKIESGETAEEAVKREIKEETNLDTKHISLLGKRSVQLSWKDEEVLAHREIFLVEWKGTIALSGEHSRYKWVDLKRPGIIYYKGTNEILELITSRVQT
jgi:8-oxo-dGTP diphosphatase